MAKKEVPIIMGAPAWTATFGDLMNLLLCFFVLLFSMSSVDKAKFEAIAASFSNAFGIFTGGEMAFGEGALVGKGTTQLNSLDAYTTSMGKSQNGENKKEVSEEEKAAMEVVEEAQTKASEELYKEISSAFNEDPAIAQSIEMNYTSQYVQLTIQGGILFDAGSVAIKEEALPVLAKVGKVLETYSSGTIEIEGHTDNFPTTGSGYANNDELSSFRALSIFYYLNDTTTIEPSRVKHSGRGEWEPTADNSTPEGRARNRRVEIRIYNPLSAID